MIEILKYLFILMNSIFIFTKLIRRPLEPQMLILSFAFSAIVSFITKITRIYIPFFTVAFLIGAIIFFTSAFYRTGMKNHITTSIISLAITYSVHLLLNLFFVTVFYFISLPLWKQSFIDTLLELIIGSLEFFILYAFFRNKRFRNGIPSLIKRDSNSIGLIISISILVVTSLFTPNLQPNLLWLVPISIIAICVILLYLWGKAQIKKDYIKRVQERNETIIQNELMSRDIEINKLRAHNDTLASIIHRDNKLIPAMEAAVRECIMSIKSNDLSSEISEKANLLLRQLTKMARSRTEIITEYENKGKRFPVTNVPLIDILLSYFITKAEKDDIHLTFSYIGNVTEFIDSYISETDVQTLMADLIENAMTAVQNSEKRLLDIVIDLSSDYPVIHFYDSGAPFKIDVLAKIGLRRISTRETEGGSGIGLMSIFSLLQKYKASFELEEFSNDFTYTKRISLYFDGLNECRIKSPRNNEISSQTKRIDFVLLP